MSTLFNMLARILEDRHSKQQLPLALYCTALQALGLGLASVPQDNRSQQRRVDKRKH